MNAHQRRSYRRHETPEKWMLIKYSAPGWEKEYPSRSALIEALAEHHICGTCLAGQYTYVGTGGTLVTEQEDRIPNRRSLRQLLSTCCGCEFGAEKVRPE